MPEYLSPGVYVEEIDAGPKSIEGVSTSTAGAVGVTAFGPTEGKPELVTSFSEFVRKFGGFLEEPTDRQHSQWALNPVEGGRWWNFPLSVKGFFDNGGQRLYVKRVIPAAATAASAQLGKGLVSEIVSDAAVGANTLQLRTLVGIDKGTSITLLSAGTPAPTPLGDFQVIRYNPSSLTITLSGLLAKPVKAGRDFVQVRAIKPPPADRTCTIRSRNRGVAGNSLQARIRPDFGAVATILADPALGGNPVKASVQKATVRWTVLVDDITKLSNDDMVVKIKGVPYTIKERDTAARTFVVLVEDGHDVATPEDTAGGSTSLKIKDEAGTTDLATIQGLGTRSLIEVADATAYDVNDTITFLPTRSQHKVVAKVGSFLEIKPVIPIGRDWESRKIRKSGLDFTKVTEVKTAPAAATDKVEVKDRTVLAKGNSVSIKGKTYTIAEDPEATTGGAPAAGKEGTITVSPAMAAGDLPAANDPIGKRIAESTVTATASPWTIEATGAAGLGVGERILLNGEEYEVLSLATNTPAAGTTTIGVRSHIDRGNRWPAGTTLRRVRSAMDPAHPNRLRMSNAGSLYRNAVVELDNGEKKERALITSIRGETIEFASNLQNRYSEGHKVRVIEAQVSIRQVEDGSVTREESVPNLRLTDDKTTNYLPTGVEALSTLARIDVPLGAGFPTLPDALIDLANFPIAETGGWVELAGGEDRMNELAPEDFVGTDEGSGRRSGILALEDIDEVSICVVPGMWSATVQNALIQHCEYLKDRFAILDPKDGLSIEGIREFREPIDTKYAALYYPWVEVRDPLSRRNVEVAPSGHMAGLYARVDNERGVHKAPANEVIRGITKIAQDVSKREQDMLNPKNINVLRFFPGRGNRVWGARVVTSDASWKYINVRRLFIYIEESIDEGLQWVVFEPNDSRLWSRVRQTIGNFLTTVWRNGALFGTRVSDAYIVRCDESTMTPTDIDNGLLICEVAIAPVKPAEFVVIRIQQKTLNASEG